MEKNIKVGVHNRFDFVRRDAKTGEVLGEYKAENIILDGFWAKYLSTTGYDCFKYIHFGSGTTTPTASDVKLTSWVGYKAAPAYDEAGTIYNTSDFYSGVVSFKKSIRLQDTEYNGSFISEIGYSSSTSSTSGLLTKALVKDMNGNVVNIEKRDGEVLDIFATFYVNIGTSFDSGNIFFSADATINTNMLIWQFMGCNTNTRQWTISSSYAQYLQGRPQPQSGRIAAVGAYQLTPTPSPDVPNKKIVYTVPNLVAASGNVAGGIRGLNLGGVGVKLPCTGFSQPVLTKEVVGAGDGSNKDFQTKFGHIKDNGAAKVYVNDVEVSATVDYNQMYPKTNLVNDLPIVDWWKPTASENLRDCIQLGIGSASNTWLIAENPWHSKAPIASIRGAYFTAYGSNDLSSWTQITQRTGSSSLMSIPAGNQNFRYIKLESYLTGSMAITEINSSEAAALKNIHLASAPAVGDTVAVTYQPDCIAKDDQHVLNNVKITLTFNEYTL